MNKQSYVVADTLFKIYQIQFNFATKANLNKEDNFFRKYFYNFLY